MYGPQSLKTSTFSGIDFSDFFRGVDKKGGKAGYLGGIDFSCNPLKEQPNHLFLSVDPLAKLGERGLDKWRAAVKGGVFRGDLGIFVFSGPIRSNRACLHA